jgi:hypothetical protein
MIYTTTTQLCLNKINAGKHLCPSWYIYFVGIDVILSLTLSSNIGAAAKMTSEASAEPYLDEVSI